MIINTFSYLWKGSALDSIRALIPEGYREFEFPISSPYCWPLEMPTEARAALIDCLAENEASVRSLNAGGYDLNLASPAASMRRKSIDHITTVIELATQIDAREVVISPGTRRPMISPPLSSVYDWLYESLRVLIPVARDAGVRLLMENTPYCFTPTLEEMARVVEDFDDDALRIVYDVANAAFIEEDPVAGLNEHHDAIGLIHISDTGLDEWGHDPIGTGVIDWHGLGTAVAQTCGIENVVLEIIREEDPLSEFRQAMKDLADFGWRDLA
ncbi:MULTISPECIES: sugar phosphate isomerase/epimerase [unclassified Actinomyces]|uniref:sugar phosphate isomerase/epimerase family protein n=1 Tax=unclassified Actinomyces TaxID=2609248 RepID=UPI000D5966A4|nr:MULTISPECIES: sugar phosphate isomerase/epimerase family protein [unclassified Actinomyces]RAX21321.1 sugar phosphate isomerase/epimerase [Actinomyces sp. Z5]RAX22651.1 sugar phosphate isomerase/epimerase [Actinomyces sp. Z3]